MFIDFRWLSSSHHIIDNHLLDILSTLPSPSLAPSSAPHRAERDAGSAGNAPGAAGSQAAKTRSAGDPR